ncbi:MAG: hypothetical protein ACYCY1_06195 [Sulfuriferula sp.]
MERLSEDSRKRSVRLKPRFDSTSSENARRAWQSRFRVDSSSIFFSFERPEIAGFRAATAEIGFKHAACGPMVRSSYHADQQAQGVTT